MKSNIFKQIKYTPFLGLSLGLIFLGLFSMVIGRLNTREDWGYPIFIGFCLPLAVRMFIMYCLLRLLLREKVVLQNIIEGSIILLFILWHWIRIFLK